MMRISDLLVIFGVSSLVSQISARRPPFKMEAIPADPDLLNSEVSLNVEHEMAHKHIGSSSNDRVRRRLRRKLREYSPKGGFSDLDQSYQQNSPEASLASETSSASTKQALLQDLEALKSRIEQQIEVLQDSLVASNERTSDVLAATRKLVKRAEATIRKRRGTNPDKLMPYRACIYIDTPGQDGEDDGEPLIPEEFTAIANIKCPQVAVAAAPVQPPTSTAPPAPAPAPVTQPVRLQPHAAMFKSDITTVTDDDANIDQVFWMRMPPGSDLNDQKDMLRNLFMTIDDFHHEGKDVLFIPIEKTDGNAGPTKHGFLRSLKITPERLSAYKDMIVKDV